MREALPAQGQTVGSADAVYVRGMERLISVVQELSLARDLPTVMALVRRAARELTGADGATFVLRDGDMCHYVDEDAVAPLWKGRRFPMSACVSGWVMLNRQPVVIPDIYNDPRVPADAYRPTFVKSLAMVPIRTTAPIGAIGNYWAALRRASDQEVRLLQALADSTSIALENIGLYAELEDRVRERTARLQEANRELETFSYSVSHDLRAPLRAIDGFSRILEEENTEKLDEQGRDHLRRIRAAARRMEGLIDGMLTLSRITRRELVLEPIDLSSLARDVTVDLKLSAPARAVDFLIQDGLAVKGDRTLLRSVLENLLGNAWKFTAKKERARIEFGAVEGAGGEKEYFVKDDGAGFNMAAAGKLFGAFQRLHADKDFSGTGIGLATTRRIIQRHGGRIRGESTEGQGAVFTFTLPEKAAPPADVI